MLILTTNLSRYKAENHGFQYKGDKINIKKRGLFADFHDSYSDDKSIYQKEYSFKLENLVKGLPVRENEINGIFLRENKDFLISKAKEEKSGQKVILHELDREFLFTFALSSLSRYKIVEWSNLLRGLSNDFIVEVQRYMQSIQVFFPLIICSYIFGKKLIPEFYPAEISELDR